MLIDVSIVFLQLLPKVACFVTLDWESRNISVICIWWTKIK